MKQLLSLVIPIYNEEANLQTLYERISGASDSYGMPFECVMVNDGSRDRSLPLMQEIVEQDGRFRVVNLSRNFGHQAAISAGLLHARGDVVAILDGDLQDPPEELHRFLAKWYQGYDVVYAIRQKRKEGFFKKLAYKLFYLLLSKLSEIDIPLDSGDFCVMDRQVVRVLNHEMPEQFRFVRGLRAYAGFKQIGVTYERGARHAGEVKYTFAKLLNLALSGLLDFSTFPLRISTGLGFLISLGSILVGLFFIVHRILDFKIFGYSPTDTPGLATLAVGLFFLSGVMLVVMGIMGEYLGRMYMEVKRRPFYIIREVIEQTEDQGQNSKQ